LWFRFGKDYNADTHHRQIALSNQIVSLFVKEGPEGQLNCQQLASQSTQNMAKIQKKQGNAVTWLSPK